MNVELLERTKETIMNADLFNMGSWCECVGHYVCITADVVVHRDSSSILPVLEDLLGIDHSAAKLLCYLEYWPEQYGGQTAYWSSIVATRDCPALHSRENACARIDYFIATNATDIEQPIKVLEEELVFA